MGSAAAHHLSASMPELLLIGAAEPNDPGTHRGVFGSHYDESRIVRCLDPDGFWSSVAIRSLERAEQLQKKTAIRFLHRVGHLILTVDSPYAAKYAADVDRVGEQNRIDYQLLDADTIAQRFPFLATARAWQGRYERGNAGWLNPREQIRAQISAAVANGATVVEDTVERIVSSASPLEIETCGGARYRSHQVLVAAGVFSNGDGLLPVDLDLFFCGRTVLLLELHPEDLEGLRDMPTIIFRGQTQRRSAYIVPPVRYSDGRWFLKMGGITPDEQPLRSVEEIKRWFRRPGSQEVAELLMATARGNPSRIASCPLDNGDLCQQLHPQPPALHRTLFGYRRLCVDGWKWQCG